jgi:hypothetical protein
MATIRTSPAKRHEYCANDPFGNFITFPERVKDLDGKETSFSSLYEQAMEVISDPVMILDMKNDEVEFYYYRKFDSLSLLVGARKFEDHFIASRCQVDPTPSQLSVLYRKAKQIH